MAKVGRPTKEATIIKNLKGNSFEPKTPIANDMFIPNHSGISTHPEALAAFATLPVDISDDTNLAVSSPITLTGDTIGLGTVDISDDTNLAVSSPITLVGDTVGFDFSTTNTWTGGQTWNNTQTWNSESEFKALMKVVTGTFVFDTESFQHGIKGGNNITVQKNGSQASSQTVSYPAIVATDVIALKGIDNNFSAVQSFQSRIETTGINNVTSNITMNDTSMTGVDTITFTDTGGTISGIQNQNLVDKSATESISGAWTHTGKTVLTNAGADTLQVKATTANNTAVQVVDGVTNTLRFGSLLGIPAVTSATNVLGMGQSNFGALTTYVGNVITQAAISGIVHSNATQINSTLGVSGVTTLTNDLIFSGATSGVPFAEIYANDAAATITITTAGQANKVQVTTFNTNGVSNAMTPDHTNDHITCDNAGMYLATLSISADSVAGTAAEFAFSLYKNNGATEFPNVTVKRDMAAGAGGNHGSMSMSGIIDLAATDTIELWVWNNTNTQNIVIDNVTLSLIQVGGT